MPHIGQRRHLHSFQADEKALLMKQDAEIPITQFVDSVDAASQDEENRQREEDHKYLEHPRQWLLLLGIPAPASCVAHRVVEGEPDEQGQCEDLER